MRVITVVSAAREAIRMSRSYGNPDLIYSFPSTAVPPPRSSKKRGSTLATREAEPPSGKSTLAVRTSLDVPLIAARVCRSCENPAHMLPACPVLYYTDTNTHHTCNWCDSVLGQAWLANGEVMWQERLILPGYENRQRYHPAVTPPFLMNNNKKAKNNHGSGNQGTQNQGNQGNFNRGNQNQGAGNQGAGRGYQGKNPRGGKHNPPQGGGGGNPSSDSAGKNQGTNGYDVNTSDMSILPHFMPVISHADTISTLIHDEYLHDPSTLPSNHLNITVSVQDKDKGRQSSVRRVMGKAVLDTANYSEDFISFTMTQKLTLHE